MKSNPSRTLFRTLFATGLLAAGLCSCCPKHNTLTQAEIADGWQLLFDGKSLDQWKDFNGDSLTMPWHVVDGCIQAAGDGSDLSGYIVTKKQYENFILDWDWKLSYGGNSGMLYHVVENPYFKVPYVTGPEYQLIDNAGWEATNAPTRLEEWQKLGVDYAMHLPNPDSLLVNPQGEWNSSRIVCDNGHVSIGSTAARSSNSKPGPTTGSPARTAANGRRLPNTDWRTAACCASRTTATPLRSAT